MLELGCGRPWYWSPRSCAEHEPGLHIDSKSFELDACSTECGNGRVRDAMFEWPGFRAHHRTWWFATTWRHMERPQRHRSTHRTGLLSAGTYLFFYSVEESGCTDQATVTVTLDAAPNAGTNAVITVCSTDPPFNLYQELGGMPNVGGAWTAPIGIAMSGVFDPAVDPPGVYVYTVVGVPPCMNATSTLVITVAQAPNAGIDGSASYCLTDAPFVLLDQLGGSPSPGGTWTFNGVAHGAAFFPGTDVPGEYVYTLPGSSPCGNATSSVMVTLNSCIVTAPVNMGIQSVAE